MSGWDFDRLNTYIQDQIEENINLDYKSSGSLEKSPGKKSEISKDVSAFANSAGGVIIYGISEYDEKDKNHLPEKLSPINRMDYSKEWLEQVINSNISPKIDGLRIHSIPVSNSNPNQVAYVVEIPKSNTAHQARDKRYYKRYNFESTAMEDYEIRDIMNRSNKTDIEIRLIINGNYRYLDEWLNKKTRFEINTDVHAYNNGNLITKYLEVFLCINADEAIHIINPQVPIEDDQQIRFNNEKDRKIVIQDNEFIVGVDRLPILPNNSQNLGSFDFYSDIIFEDMLVNFIISTEDTTKTIEVKGRDLLGVIK